MSEEPTGRLEGDGSFESRVLEQLAALREGMNFLSARLSGVEDRLLNVETRLSGVETRISGVELRLSGVETRLSGVETRLSALEETVEARLRETRPIWETVLSRVETIDEKLYVLGRDLLDTRADVAVLQKHLPPAA